MGAVEVTVIILSLLVFMLLMLGLRLSTQMAALSKRSDDELTPPKTDASPVSKKAQRLMFVYVLIVLVGVVATHVIGDGLVCAGTTTTTPSSESVTMVETEVTEGDFAGTNAPAIDNLATTTTSTPATSMEVTTCGGLSIGLTAVLFVPGLLLLLPALKSLNIAGMFGLDFKEVEAKVDEQIKDGKEQRDLIDSLITLTNETNNQQQTIIQVVLKDQLTGISSIVSEGVAQSDGSNVDDLDLDDLRSEPDTRLEK